MLATDQIELLSAALRYREDAEALLSSSPDQSWHLAGYATECVRKALITIEPYRRALAHEQGRHFDALFDLVAALDAKAARLDVQGWASAGTSLAEWSEQHRYAPRNRHAARAPDLVREVAAHHDRTLTALWLNELFDPGTL